MKDDVDDIDQMFSCSDNDPQHEARIGHETTTKILLFLERLLCIICWSTQNLHEIKTVLEF